MNAFKKDSPTGRVMRGNIELVRARTVCVYIEGGMGIRRVRGKVESGKKRMRITKFHVRGRKISFWWRRRRFWLFVEGK